MYSCIWLNTNILITVVGILSHHYYTDIKEKLVNLGIPTDEVQFIQCATTERARKRLFEDMNNGKVRVLFGSTTMLGTGVNAQQRAVAVHHLEIPWVRREVV